MFWKIRAILKIMSSKKEITLVSNELVALQGTLSKKNTSAPTNITFNKEEMMKYSASELVAIMKGHVPRS